MSLYGYCPQCGARGVRRERRLNGDDICEAGHTYPTAQSHSQPYKLIDRLTRENADLRATLAAAENARDEQAEAVRVLANELRWYATCTDELHTCHVDKLPCEACENITRLNVATRETQNNPIAAAAVKEAGGG
jgi:hypothetical protein